MISSNVVSNVWFKTTFLFFFCTHISFVIKVFLCSTSVSSFKIVVRWATTHVFRQCSTGYCFGYTQKITIYWVINSVHATFLAEQSQHISSLISLNRAINTKWNITSWMGQDLSVESGLNKWVIRNSRISTSCLSFAIENIENDITKCYFCNQKVYFHREIVQQIHKYK